MTPEDTMTELRRIREERAQLGPNDRSQQAQLHEQEQAAWRALKIPAEGLPRELAIWAVVDAEMRARQMAGEWHELARSIARLETAGRPA